MLSWVKIGLSPVCLLFVRFPGRGEVLLDDIRLGTEKFVREQGIYSENSRRASEVCGASHEVVEVTKTITSWLGL